MSSPAPDYPSLLKQFRYSLQDSRREVLLQKNVSSSFQMALEGHHLAAQAKHRQDLDALAQSFHSLETRWTERLQRLVDWKQDTIRLHHEFDRIDRYVQQSKWLARAQRRIESLIVRMMHRVAAHSETDRLLHQQLQDWTAAIETADDASSQGRSLGMELRQARIRWNRLLTRVNTVRRILSKHIHSLPGSLDIRGRELETALRPIEHSLKEHRAQVLADSLLHESGLHRLRQHPGQP